MNNYIYQPIPEFRAWLKTQKVMIDVNAIDFAFNQICGADEEGDYYDWYDYNEIELIQFVHRYDKNKKKMYVGDIVKVDRKMLNLNNTGEFLAVVEFNTEDSTFCLYDTSCDECHELHRLSEKFYEIVGNIYQDYNLIEEYNERED